MDIWATEDEKKILDTAGTFEELNAVAMGVLARIPRRIVMVCGPISSGGTGVMDKNLEVFGNWIRWLRQRAPERGEYVFAQLPFERAFQRILRTPYCKGGKHLLETFYLPIFASGLVTKLYFIPGWASSFGASWERMTAGKLGLPIEDL